jgi:hypothetical protein
MSNPVSVSLILASLVIPPANDARFTFVDLQSKANQKLTDEFHNDEPQGNTLKNLPRGRQTFGDVVFDIGEGVMQLGCPRIPKKPDEIKGIPVGAKFHKLHYLHAAGYGTLADDDVVIACYIIRYEDQSKETIEIVNGQDLKDWWSPEGDTLPTRAQVAWVGENDAAKKENFKIRLYAGVWTNPHPDKKVTSIDFVNIQDSLSAPFCVAITLEK